MRTVHATLLPFLLALAVPAAADVVITMSGRDASGAETADNTIYVRGEDIRIDNVGGVSGHMSMIFLGDEMIVINIDEKEYFRLDEATLQRFDSQMNEAMRMMQQQLSNLPPEQRAMAERMMQGRMQGMSGPGAAPSPPPRVVKGGPDSHGDYACTQYTVFEGDELTQEICAAGPGEVEGLGETQVAFSSMSAFLQRMTSTFGAGPLANVGRTPMDLMDQLEGFPVLTRRFRAGQLVEEVFVSTVTSAPVDASLFEPPPGYTEQEVVPAN